MKAGVGQIDFVVAHELCHLRYFSHNAGFYALLGEVMPDWKEQEAMLHQVV
jgi:predicted metal-dependent hydrolase